MNYSIVSHDAVTALVRPHLVDAGVLYYPIRMDHRINGNRTEVVLTTRFSSIDDPGDFIEVQSAGYGIDSQDKGAGKAISYAVKYALLKALGLETGDDPDVDQNSIHKPDENLGAVAQMVRSSADLAGSPAELDRFYLENRELFNQIQSGDIVLYNQTMDHLKKLKVKLNENSRTVS